MIDISGFNKDQLAEYAMKQYSVDLDMRKSLNNLIAEVKKLQVKQDEKPKVVEQKKPSATHIKNNDTGLVFELTEALVKHMKGYSTLCDKDGNPVK
jgi:hypothetical protein